MIAFKRFLLNVLVSNLLLIFSFFWNESQFLKVAVHLR